MSSPIDNLLPKDWDEWTPGEKESYFRENADEIKQETVQKPLSQEELSDAQQKLSMRSVKLRKLQRKYDEVKKDWRENKINPAKEKVDVLLDQLEQEQEEIEGNVYYIRDFQNEMVYGVLADGTVVKARPMLHEEKQHTTQSHMRKVNNENSN